MLHTLRVTNASDENIEKLGCIKKLKYLKILSGDITHFVCPQTLVRLSCKSIGLKTLVLNYGLRQCDCSNNCITDISVSDTVIILDCSNNKLKTLDIPGGMETLDADNNDIEVLTSRQPLHALSSLSIQNNKIQSLIDFALPFLFS